MTEEEMIIYFKSQYASVKEGKEGWRFILNDDETFFSDITSNCLIIVLDK